MPALLNRLRNWAPALHLPKRMAISLFRPRRGLRLPSEVQIEATSRCNLSCPTCAHAKESRSGQHLTPEGLRTVLDALPRRPRQVILSGVGEPLVNPHFLTLVDILAERGIACVFYTNGTLLRPEMRHALLARENIQQVAISCDGARKETFESLRRGADFDKWREYVGLFLAEARQRRGAPIRLPAFVVASKLNLNELPEIIRFVAAMGFDRANLLDPIPADNESAALCPSGSELEALRSSMIELDRHLNFRIDTWFRRTGSRQRSILRCLQPWEYVFVRANGDVAPCCALFGSDQAAVMGNIFVQPFIEIWHGKQFGEYRAQSAAGVNPRCRVCPYS
jgi:radical SAM protein with 4Fe4S-binding SPASM domain